MQICPQIPTPPDGLSLPYQTGRKTSRISRTVTDAPSGASQPAKGSPQGSAGGRRWQIESTVDYPNQPTLL